MPLQYGKTNNAQPTRIADSTTQIVRCDAQGDLVTVPLGTGEYGLAMEGSYFRAVNPTYNTAIAISIAAATAFSETQGSIMIRNSNPAGGKDIILDYIKLIIAVAGTGNTNLNFSMQTDNQLRYTSGGSLLTINNANPAYSNATGAVIHAGALTIVTATANARKLCAGAMIVKAAAPAANDVFLFNFGAIDSVAQAPGVAVANNCGTVVIPAGDRHVFLMSFFGAAQSAAPTGFFEIGYFER